MRVFPVMKGPVREPFILGGGDSSSVCTEFLCQHTQAAFRGGCSATQHHTTLYSITKVEPLTSALAWVMVDRGSASLSLGDCPSFKDAAAMAMSSTDTRGA